MAIRKRNGGYQVDVSIGGKRLRRTVFSLAAAQELEETARTRMEKGLTPEPPHNERGPTSLRRLVDLTFQLEWAGSKNERMARGNIRQALDFFGGETHPSDITTASIDDYVAHLKNSGNADATVNRKLAALRRVLAVGHDRGWVSEIPKFRRMKESAGRIVWLEPVDEQRVLSLLETQENPELRDIVIFLIDTGARAGEAANLPWSDVNMDARTITFWDTKGGRPRTVPMTERVFQTLSDRRRRVLAGSQPTLVFKGWLDGRGRTLPLSSAWRNLAGELGLKVRLHDLRHTFASRLVQAGASIKAVQELLGHATLQMTMRYAHLAPENLRDTVALLDGVTDSGQNPQLNRRLGG